MKRAKVAPLKHVKTFETSLLSNCGFRFHWIPFNSHPKTFMTKAQSTMNSQVGCEKLTVEVQHQKKMRLDVPFVTSEISAFRIRLVIPNTQAKVKQVLEWYKTAVVNLDTQAKLKFPPQSSHERMQVHVEAQRLNLQTKSFGTDKKRFVLVTGENDTGDAPIQDSARAFKGEVVVVDSELKASNLCDRWREEGGAYLGVDTEWNATDSKPQQVLLLQVASRTLCGLFRLQYFNFKIPSCLLDLLKDKAIVGHHLDHDFRMLKDSCGFDLKHSVKDVVDTGELYNRIGFSRTNLPLLAKTILNCEVIKLHWHTLWDHPKLTGAQVKYAADDAVLPLLLREKYEEWEHTHAICSRCGEGLAKIRELKCPSDEYCYGKHFFSVSGLLHHLKSKHKIVVSSCEECSRYCFDSIAAAQAASDAPLAREIPSLDALKLNDT